MVIKLLQTMGLCYERVFRNCKNVELQNAIKQGEQELEKLKSSFPKEQSNAIEKLLLTHYDYVSAIMLEEKNNLVALAVKIGIELGIMFEQFEDF